jgi:hypothetical protein
MNVKLNFKATFINIMYTYLQPFRGNFNFLNKIFFYTGCVKSRGYALGTWKYSLSSIHYGC